MSYRKRSGSITTKSSVHSAPAVVVNPEAKRRSALENLLGTLWYTVGSAQQSIDDFTEVAHEPVRALTRAADAVQGATRIDLITELNDVVNDVIACVENVRGAHGGKLTEEEARTLQRTWGDGSSRTFGMTWADAALMALSPVDDWRTLRAWDVALKAVRERWTRNALRSLDDTWSGRFHNDVVRVQRDTLVEFLAGFMQGLTTFECIVADALRV